MNAFFAEADLSNRFVLLIAGLVFVVCTCTFSYAQEALGIDPTGRSGDERDQFLEEQLKEKPKPLPPVQILPQIPPPRERKPERMPLGRVLIRDIKITGSTVFSAEELAEITAPYLNRELSAEDLEALRRSITLLYINKGYINSGAVIPDQTVADGTVTLNVVEGELTRTEVEGVKWLLPGYITKRIALGAKPPLNVARLQERLQLLQQDRRIERINAKLKPGVRPGQSVLNVRVEERDLIHFWTRFNNYQSPSVGSEIIEAGLTHQSLTGHGDILSFSYGASEGIDPRIHISYSLPVNARNTTLIFSYEKNDFSVIEEPFSAIDVESESEIFGITVRHPLYRTLNQEFALALMGEHLKNQTYLLGIPYTFSLGAENGESIVTAFRFSQEWTYRSQMYAISVRSRFSLGVDALDSTTHDNSEIPDSQFLSWLGQFQLARRLDLWDSQVILRADIQLTNDPLLSLEKMAVGGRYSVRGYRENQMVRDYGLITSLEYRVPLIRDESWADIIQLAAFLDYGKARNKDMSTPEPDDIGSMGLGLRWAVTLPQTLKWKIKLRPQFEIFWGYPFRNIDNPQHDLQDEGIHFQFMVTAF